MTDIKSTIAELHYLADWAQHHLDKAKIANDAADAIEALQGENERLKRQLDAGKDVWRQDQARIAELQAKLDELQRQEPVAHTTAEELEFLKYKGRASAMLFNFTEPDQKFVALYAAPKALEPLTDCRIELVTAIHTLASHYENRLHRLDADDRKLAEGDIAHAIKIASKWNWNGITKGTP